MTSGQILEGRFELLQKIGRGGQATTWLARELERDKRVVVKHLALGQVEQWKHIERFEREGQVLASIDHPQIPDYISAIAVTDEGQVDFYLVQEHIQGQNLAQELSLRGCWTQEEAKAALRELLQVLCFLQRRAPPVIHRDLKPSNLMRRDEDGQLVIIDFGAAQLAGSDPTMTTASLGTAAYMPFEQMSGRAVPASDVYSLGVTICHMLTGIAPDDVELGGESLDYMPLLRQAGVDDGVLLSVLSKMIQLSLNKRFLNAKAALAALDGGAPGDVARPMTTSPLVEAQPPLKVLAPPARADALAALLKAGPKQRRGLTRFLIDLEVAPLYQRHQHSLGRKLGFVPTERQMWFAFPFVYTISAMTSDDGLILITERTYDGGQSVTAKLHTLLDDGSRVVTYRGSRGFFDGQTRHVISTGDLERDVVLHMDAVRQLAAERGAAVIPHIDLNTIFTLDDDLVAETSAKYLIFLNVVLMGLSLVVVPFYFVFLIYAMARRRQLPAGQPIMYALAPGHETPQSAEVYLGLEGEQRAEAQVQQAQEQRG